MCMDNISLDLKKLPFSRAGSGYYLFEEDNRDNTAYIPGIYFGMSNPNGMARREGLIRIVPVKDGEQLSYTYSCSQSTLKIITESGTLAIVMDTTESFRIYGDGIGVMIHKEMPVMSMETVREVRPGVAEFNLFSPAGGGGRFVFSRVSGIVNVETSSMLTADGVNRCTIWLLPLDDGQFETLVTPFVPQAGEVMPKPRDEVIAEIEEEFDAFYSKFAPVPSKWEGLKQLCAYMCWINYRDGNPDDMVPVMLSDMFCASRLTDMQCYTWHQPFYGMSFADAKAALAAITNAYPCIKNGMLPITVCSGRLRYGSFPLYHGYALIKLLDAAGNSILSEDAAAELYDRMKSNFIWWKDSHSFGDGRISYNSPLECGFASSSYSALEFPLEAPDLYAQMILYSELLGRVERLAGKGNGLDWYMESQALKKTLVEELWDKEKFLCRGAISGKKYECGSLLTYVPIILGKRLENEIIEKLEKTICDENSFLSARGLVSECLSSEYYDAAIPGSGTVETALQYLIVSGFVDAGKRLVAEAVANRTLQWTADNAAVMSIPVEGGITAKARPADVYESAAAAAIIALAALF